VQAKSNRYKSKFFDYQLSYKTVLPVQENGTCCKGDSCKFGHAMLGLDLNKADFEFSRDANHHMSLDQITRVCGLCNDFVKVTTSVVS